MKEIYQTEYLDEEICPETGDVGIFKKVRPAGWMFDDKNGFLWLEIEGKRHTVHFRIG